MLVYANSFEVNTPAGDISGLLAAVDSWLVKKSRGVLSAAKSINIPARRLPDGQEVEVIFSGEAGVSAMLLGSITYSHPDLNVSGRKWFTRIGIRQLLGAAVSRVTVVVETSDISVQSGNARVFATRPGVVPAIVKKCGLSSTASADRVQRLDAENLSKVVAELDSPERAYAIIILSPEPYSERLLGDPEEILDQVVGLATVYYIPTKQDAKEVSRALGRRRSSWDGAVKIVYPSQGRSFTPVQLLPREEVERSKWEERSLARYLLFILTHRLNLPNYRAEITPSQVREYALNLRLNELETQGLELEVAQLETQTLQEKLLNQTQTILQLNHVNAALKDKIVEQEGAALRISAEADRATEHWFEAQRELEKIPVLESEILQYRDAFRKLKSQGRLQTSEEIAPSTVAEAVENAVDQYPDELVFVFNSKSDDKDCPFLDVDEVVKAFDWLVTRYRAAKLGKIQIPRFDHDLKHTLSNWDYSAKQSAVALGSSKEWYQVMYNGRKIVIEEHLKRGKSRNPEETIRIGFAWCDQTNRVVVGFIGQHQENTKT